MEIIIVIRKRPTNEVAGAEVSRLERERTLIEVLRVLELEPGDVGRV